MPLEFPPFGALFVVFRESVGEKSQGTSNFVTVEQVQELEGSWTVSFEPDWGGPGPVVFEELVNWSERPENGIRFYSGTATYSKTFTLPATIRKAGGLLLDLGDLCHMASVRINGEDAGVVWAPPFRVDIAPFAQPGENMLEVEVVNNWPNRLIGDAAQSPEDRFTRTNITKFEPDTPLEPSGLMGPVRIIYTD
ncbi:MAG: hypothetical protein R6V12_10010 [Candidatus Hydrogenedentota bacterium]